ncbi:hypothetical protein TNCV_246901 [Trichonephila clavipes]|nr:hypothetical protein TNCV_246901 [Trichonephila clavipes]
MLIAQATFDRLRVLARVFSVYQPSLFAYAAADSPGTRDFDVFPQIVRVEEYTKHFRKLTVYSKAFVHIYPHMMPFGRYFIAPLFASAA